MKTAACSFAEAKPQAAGGSDGDQGRAQLPWETAVGFSDSVLASWYSFVFQSV